MGLFLLLMYSFRAKDCSFIRSLAARSLEATRPRFPSNAQAVAGKTATCARDSKTTNHQPPPLALRVAALWLCYLLIRYGYTDTRRLNVKPIQEQSFAYVCVYLMSVEN